MPEAQDNSVPSRLRAGDIALCRLEDHVACFCRSSGTTHILDALSGELLAWLDADPQAKTASEAEAHFADLLGVPEAELSPNIQSALHLLISEELVLEERG